MLPRKTRAIRIMPNTPCLVRSGTSVFSCGTATRSGDAALAKRLFSAVGFCEEVPEVLIDSCTGLSGSGPAYVTATPYSVFPLVTNILFTKKKSINKLIRKKIRNKNKMKKEVIDLLHETFFVLSLFYSFYHLITARLLMKIECTHWNYSNYLIA